MGFTTVTAGTLLAAETVKALLKQPVRETGPCTTLRDAVAELDAGALRLDRSAEVHGVELRQSVQDVRDGLAPTAGPLFPAHHRPGVAVVDLGCGGQLSAPCRGPNDWAECPADRAAASSDAPITGDR